MPMDILQTTLKVLSPWNVIISTMIIYISYETKKEIEEKPHYSVLPHLQSKYKHST